jgi:hypothetical protein
MCRVDVMKSIQSRFHVSNSWFVGVGGKDGVSCGDVGMRTRQQPTDTANEVLIGFLLPKLGGRVIGIDGWRDGIDWNARLVGCSRRSYITTLSGEAFD